MKAKLTKPPMGWNSWDCYGASVTEEEVRRNAEYMAKNLKEFGWEYVVVDIQWFEPNAKSADYNKDAPLIMDEYSRLMPAVNRFPSAEGGKGFKPLADYVHSLGLKFGIHILRGIPKQAIRQNRLVLDKSNHKHVHQFDDRLGKHSDKPHSGYIVKQLQKQSQSHLSVHYQQ